MSDGAAGYLGFCIITGLWIFGVYIEKAARILAGIKIHMGYNEADVDGKGHEAQMS